MADQLVDMSVDLKAHYSAGLMADQMVDQLAHLLVVQTVVLWAGATAVPKVDHLADRWAGLMAD